MLLICSSPVVPPRRRGQVRQRSRSKAEEAAAKGAKAAKAAAVSAMDTSPLLMSHEKTRLSLNKHQLQGFKVGGFRGRGGGGKVRAQTASPQWDVVCKFGRD